LIDKAGSSLKVRKVGGTLRRPVRTTPRRSGSASITPDKKVNDIDAGQVKEKDYVICKGTEEKAGVVQAALISKRLSHSQ